MGGYKSSIPQKNKQPFQPKPVSEREIIFTATKLITRAPLLPGKRKRGFVLPPTLMWHCEGCPPPYFLLPLVGLSLSPEVSGGRSGGQIRRSCGRHARGVLSGYYDAASVIIMLLLDGVEEHD